jgi:hypothetical protein
LKRREYLFVVLEHWNHYTKSSEFRRSSAGVEDLHPLVTVDLMRRCHRGDLRDHCEELKAVIYFATSRDCRSPAIVGIDTSQTYL